MISKHNNFGMPESFVTNISHQLYHCEITFVNSQHENTNSKGDLYSKTGFKDFWYTKINPVKNDVVY